jgi:hypothetical protein
MAHSVPISTRSIKKKNDEHVSIYEINTLLHTKIIHLQTQKSNQIINQNEMMGFLLFTFAMVGSELCFKKLLKFAKV